MIRVGILRALFFGFFCLSLGGCFSSSRSQLDEEKEPYYLAGKSRETAMDFEGAIESYEKCVEVNPRNSAAHLELGLLYERNDTDAAASIYHYDKYLELRPGSDNAEVIKQHILGCKQVLAREVSLGPITDAQRHELDKLVDENKSLRDEVERWRAYYKDRSLAPPTTPDLTTSSITVTQTTGQTATTTTGQTATSQTTRSTTATTAARTYKVQPGDTMASIARKNSVKLDALMSANPAVEPKKLKPGQTLNLPAT